MRRWLSVLSLLLTGLLPPQTAPTNWSKQASDAGGFTAMFPVAPKESSDTKTVPQGDIVTHLFMTTSDGFLCLIGYTDYPVEVDVEQELVLDRDNFAKEVKATVSSSQRTKFSGGPGDELPALDFTATADTGTFKGLVIVVAGRRTYMVAAFNRKGSDHTADIEYFFTAFKLTSKKS